ncbi:GDSL esterase/lipase APG [Linum grandiflorum]
MILIKLSRIVCIGSEKYWTVFVRVQHAITLPRQLELFEEYKGKLARVAGANRSAMIIRDSLYILGAGTSDFLQSYYVNPLVNKVYTPDHYGSLLIPSFNAFVKVLYRLGGRRLGVTSLPPLGCVPAARTIFMYHGQGCIARINTDAQQFDRKVAERCIARINTVLLCSK